MNGEVGDQLSEVEKPTITIRLYHLYFEGVKTIDAFRVEIKSRTGVWEEVFLDKNSLESFLRGLQAGSSVVYGPHIPLPDIPRHGQHVVVPRLLDLSSQYDSVGISGA